MNEHGHMIVDINRPIQPEVEQNTQVAVRTPEQQAAIDAGTTINVQDLALVIVTGSLLCYNMVQNLASNRETHDKMLNAIVDTAKEHIQKYIDFHHKRG